MKTHTTIALISFAIVAALLATSMAKNDIWGIRGNNNRLLYRTQVNKKAKMWRVIKTNVEFPGKKAKNLFIISQIIAIDHNRHDGGFVRLSKGGPGFLYASLYIKSKRSHGLKYTIEIYGH